MFYVYFQLPMWVQTLVKYRASTKRKKERPAHRQSGGGTNTLYQYIRG